MPPPPLRKKVQMNLSRFFKFFLLNFEKKTIKSWYRSSEGQKENFLFSRDFRCVCVHASMCAGSRGRKRRNGKIIISFDIETSRNYLTLYSLSLYSFFLSFSPLFFPVICIQYNI